MYTVENEKTLKNSDGQDVIVQTVTATLPDGYKDPFIVLLKPIGDDKYIQLYGMFKEDTKDLWPDQTTIPDNFLKLTNDECFIFE